MHYYTDLKINIVQRHDDGLFYNAADGTIEYEMAKTLCRIGSRFDIEDCVIHTFEGIVELDIFDLLESEKITWGRRVEDMLKLSKEFPNYYFRLEGHGEDWGDFWCEWYYNGKTHHAAGTTVYERDWIIEDEGQDFMNFLPEEH